MKSTKIKVTNVIDSTEETNGYTRPDMPIKQKRFLQKNLKMKHCKYCHATEDLTMDHKIPLKKGGTDDIKNMQCLCRRCNQMKSDHTEGTIQALFKWHLRTLMEKEARKKGIWIK